MKGNKYDDSRRLMDSCHEGGWPDAVFDKGWNFNCH